MDGDFPTREPNPPRSPLPIRIVHLAGNIPVDAVPRTQITVSLRHFSDRKTTMNAQEARIVSL
jgi:hypothetical protein